MGGVTYIHTKTSLVTKYCNTTDQVIISGETKRDTQCNSRDCRPPTPHACLPSPHLSPTEQLSSSCRDGERAP